MPYIEPKRRKKMDLIVNLMMELNVLADGDLNYVLYAFCKRAVVPSYHNYKYYCSELDQCITEIKRRLIGPYEDKKKKQNGDVL